MVMELMVGGDLFDRIGTKKTYNEKDAQVLCRNMLEAIDYCHNNSVAHCDMKPKNLLLVSKDDDSHIKLADFGFATRVYAPNSLTKKCGTPFFVGKLSRRKHFMSILINPYFVLPETVVILAPEILSRGNYDHQSDMWSVGVITYLLLSGSLPFMGRTQRQLFRCIVTGEYDFPDEQWTRVSKEAKDLVKKLLVTNPNDRWTAKAALRSQWIMSESGLLRRNSLFEVSQKLKTFDARMKLRTAMIAVDWISNSKGWKSSLARSMSQKKKIENDDEKFKTDTEQQVSDKALEKKFRESGINMETDNKLKNED